MSTMIRKLLLSFAVLAGSLAFAPVADACPMCKLANEEGTDPQAAAVANARPRAYMYSILFMLSMPATLTGAFGIAFYRMHLRQQPSAIAGNESPAVLPEPDPV